MKYSQHIGVGLVVAFCIVAYMPWVYLPSAQVFIKGMGSGKNIFGEMALLDLVCYGVSLLCFLVRRIWAKRTNLFATTIGLAWAFKNLILISICRGGECPERQPGAYLMFILAIGIFVMSLLPDIKIPPAKAD